jgi:hypothetical protein
MWLVEPPDNQITDPANYWWYFVVTSATVGYGDFFPVSVAGHVVGVYVIVGGIVTLALLFTPWVVVVRQGDELRVSPPWDHVVDEGTVLYYLAGERINSSRLAAVE